MSAAAVLKAASGGASRRLVQTVAIFLVLAASAAAGTLGLTLSTNANAQFLGAFARQHGADLALSIDASKVTAVDLARTRRLPGVTDAAGPYPETYISLAGSGPAASSSAERHGSGIHARTPVTVTPSTPVGRSPQRSSTTTQPSADSGVSGRLIPDGQVNPIAEYPGEGISVAGRASMGGPLDDLILLNGRWATRPGEIVLSHDRPVPAEPGATVTVTSAPGKPKLKVVGIATSVSSADLAWVVPSQLAALRPVNEPALEQMLYTFQRASTPQQIDADVAELQHALPARAVINSVSWLETASKLASIQDINTPFAVAFALIALVLAVLITASVAAAAVVASYRRIGVLKSIGFTPAQIATTYLVQIGIPALAGALAGTLLGNRWVLPLLNGGPGAAAGVPFWINVTVPLALLALTGLAALVPALRAARLSTVQTIVAAQTPRAGHGYAAHRFAGKLAVPRSVSLGLAVAFTRPARSALTLAAVTFGLTAVVLAVGLDSSIAKIDSATTQTLRSVLIGGGVPPHVHTLTPRQQRTIVATLRAQPGTLGYVDEADATASTPGVGPRVPVTAFQGNAAGLGWDITSGTWFTRPGQVVVNTAQPGTAHLAVGQTIHMTVDGKTLTARITGEVYAPGPPPVVGTLFISQQTLANAGIHLPIIRYEAVVMPASQQSYQASLQRALGPGYNVNILSLGFGTGQNHSSHGVGAFALIDTSLMRRLTIIIAVLAALGVLNSVLMLTHERIHDLGIFKALGMTPPQTILMIACWVAVPAITATIIALPTGIALQEAVLHAIGRKQDIPITAGVTHVYTTGSLALLALAGLGIALTGALGPASWAATSRTTTALRAE